jgi:hypothetical protein
MLQPRRRIVPSTLAIPLALACAAARAAAESPAVVIDRSPAPATVYVACPSIAILPDGRIARPMAVPQRSPGRRAARKSRVPRFWARTSGTRSACLPPCVAFLLPSARSLSEAGRLAALE